MEEQRYWPGGVVVVPAYGWRTNGSLASASNDSVFANNGVSYDQSAADFAAAASTVEVNPVDDLGIPTDTYYQVQVGFQIRGTGTGVNIRSSPKPADGHASDAGYPGILFPTGIDHDYFGLGRFTYSKLVGSGGDARLWSVGDTLTIKCYRTGGGSTPILLDNIYFIPVGFGPDSPAENDYTANTRYLGGDQFSELGATGAYLGAPDDDYAFGGGGGGLSDSQERAGQRDAALTYTAWCGPGSFMDQIPYNASHDWDSFHARHAYALARVKATTEGWFDRDTAGGFVALERDTFEETQAPLYTDSWGMVYLGLFTPGTDGFGMQVTQYLASAAFPECAWHDGDLEAAQTETLFFISSLHDWVNYKTGGRAYL